MSRPTIPKEKLSAYQRWELDSLDEDSKSAGITFPTAQEIEHIHQSAQQEGYSAGHQQGYAEGYRQGMANANEKVEHIQLLLSNLSHALQNLDQEIAQDLLSLALAIAKQVLYQAVAVKPDLLLSIVREAISQLPSFNQHAHLALNPLDAILVKEHMGDQLEHTGWKIIEDQRIERGGCQIETTTSEVDASLSNRWQRVVSAIAQNNDWLVKPEDEV
ncbi:MAG: flagellar assembly protein FliH [Burkholderiales bacterium]|nr:flagellar assembly protein FliH [Burkholderiales bacterium]